MKFDKAEPRNLMATVVEKMEKAIIDGDILPGEKLPPTKEIQKMLGVGRNTLREALVILSQKGLIEVRRGSHGGTFVKELGPNQLTENLSLLMSQHKVPWRELLAFRMDLDLIVTRRVMDVITEDEVKKLQSIIAEGDSLLKDYRKEYKQLLEIDQKIHMTLVGIVRNTIHEWIMKTLIDHMHNYFDRYITQQDEFLKLSYLTLKKLVEAIASGNVEHAVEATKDHYYKTNPFFEDQV